MKKIFFLQENMFCGQTTKLTSVVQLNKISFDY